MYFQAISTPHARAQKSKETNESFHGVDRKKSRRDAAGGKKKGNLVELVNRTVKHFSTGIHIVFFWTYQLRMHSDMLAYPYASD